MPVGEPDPGVGGHVATVEKKINNETFFFRPGRRDNPYWGGRGRNFDFDPRSLI